MTKYIKWPKEKDVEFRAAYLDATGEKIQTNPTEDDTYYEVGSSRYNDQPLPDYVSLSDSPTISRNIPSD